MILGSGKEMSVTRDENVYSSERKHDEKSAQWRSGVRSMKVVPLDERWKEQKRSRHETNKWK